MVALSKTAVLTKGALHAYLRPRLTTDAAIEIDPFLIGLTGSNFANRKIGLVDAITAEFKDHLAKDASLNGLAKMLDLVVAGQAMDEDYDDDDEEEEEEEEKKKKKEAEDKRKAAKDENDDDEEEKKRKEEEEKKAASDKRKAAKDVENMEVRGEMISKDAMTKAIAAAVKVARDEAIRAQNSINDARRFVAPWVGDLAISVDSEEKVYRQALKNLGCTAADSIREIAALKAILELHPKPGAHTGARREALLASDSDLASGGFFDRFPEAKRIHCA